MPLVGSPVENRAGTRASAGWLPERVAVALCLALLVLAAWLAQGADERLLATFYLGDNASQAEFWRWVSFLGSGQVLLPVVVLISLILFEKRQAMAALGLLFGWGLTTLTVEWLKWIIGRERPDVLPLVAAAGPAFPSGHAAQVVYVCFFLAALLCSTETVEAGLRRMCLGLLGVLPWAVGYSRVALGVHWPSDVLGGCAVGLFFSALALLAGHNTFRCFGKQAG